MNQPAAADKLHLASGEATRLRELSPTQWRSGVAAWLGWTFDGLELHLYTLVAMPFVALLLGVAQTDPSVKEKSAWIQGAFLVGWALGGGFFGRIGDKLGRSRALCLTILAYAVFTGLSFFAQKWWHLLACRFLAALGIGGEWAVGASLLAETWPKRWRPWIAAVLQMGVNVGILFACVITSLIAWGAQRLEIDHFERAIFLTGIVPALIVFWIRRQVPETEEWREARSRTAAMPRVRDLFRAGIVKTTVLTITICALTLSGWWAFVFWHPQYLRELPEVAALDAVSRQQLVNRVFFLVIGVSIGGNFFASWLAVKLGYRRTILWMSLAFALSFFLTFGQERGLKALLFWLPVIGFCSGMFALFTMYLPPLFPTLLRTTGAGFCYNIGRLASAAGTVVFSIYAIHVDFRSTLMAIGFVFMAAALVALFLPDLPLEEGGGVT